MSTLSIPSEDLIYSDLSGPYVYKGHEIEIAIYRLPDSEWVVEISEEIRAGVVLEELYASEESAYAAALEAVHEGILDTPITA
jgi:hypothetical protein